MLLVLRDVWSNLWFKRILNEAVGEIGRFGVVVCLMSLALQECVLFSFEIGKAYNDLIYMPYA